MPHDRLTRLSLIRRLARPSPPAAALMLRVNPQSTPPSPRVRVDLQKLQSSLKRYQSSVHGAAAIGKPWPPRAMPPPMEIIEITSSPSVQAEPTTPTKPAARVVTEQSDLEEMLLRRDYDAGEETIPIEEAAQAQAVDDRPSRAPDVANHPSADFYASTKTYDQVDCSHPTAITTDDAWFTYQQYRTTHQQPPQVLTITNEKQLNAVISKLVGPIIGFDMEWVIRRKANISVIQIADRNHIFLVQICRFTSFPTRLREIIESDSWIKVGVAIMGADMSRLREVYGVKGKGVLELSHFARLMDRPVWGLDNKLISLAKLTQHYLGKPLQKGPVRASNWNMPLSTEQRQYAADDAYAGLLIFLQLERDRQARHPLFQDVWPPVRACPHFSAAATAAMERKKGPGSKSTASATSRPYTTHAGKSAATNEVRHVMAILNGNQRPAATAKQTRVSSSSDDDGDDDFLPPTRRSRP